jgi:Thioesterase domain
MANGRWQCSIAAVLLSPCWSWSFGLSPVGRWTPIKRGGRCSSIAWSRQSSKGAACRGCPFTLVDALVSNLAPHFEGRFAFFGHSMGAVLAHELAHALRNHGLPSPSHLIVSGRRAPTVPNRFPPISHLPDHVFVAEINSRYGGIAPEILQHQDVLNPSGSSAARHPDCCFRRRQRWSDPGGKS